MAEGGSIKARLAAADARHEELNKKFIDAKFPSPRQGYRMNTDEFMHHVVALAHERLIKEKLGISDDEYKLMITEVWMEEQAKLYDAFKELKSMQLRQQLTEGIRIKPDVQL